MTMEWREVSSSTIARVAYDASSMTLAVEFVNGTRYEYFDVPQNLYDELVIAPSAGRFLSQNIKGAYRYSRV